MEPKPICGIDLLVVLIGQLLQCPRLIPLCGLRVERTKQFDTAHHLYRDLNIRVYVA